MSRYAILAATEIPKGFIDAKVATDKILKHISLDTAEFRYGHTKVMINFTISANQN